MEYEDRYSPAYEEFDTQKNTNIINDVKKLDKGYNEIYRKVEQTNGTIKNKKIVVYNSGDIGSQIRNAVTGNYTKDIVGTSAEDAYFSTILSGESSKGSLMLYFDSPEQYERHLHITLQDTIKSKWNDKRLHIEQ